MYIDAKLFTKKASVMTASIIEYGLEMIEFCNDDFRFQALYIKSLYESVWFSSFLVF